jgi:cytochrome o ubiquinol oxidase subunit 1
LASSPPRGWTAYPPYTGIEYSPGEGVDYWIWAISLSSVGSTTDGRELSRRRFTRIAAPGMTLLRMPLFVLDHARRTSILMIFAMAPLTIATLMLALDRLRRLSFLHQ